MTLSSPSLTRIAVLDDFQGVAEHLGDWKSLPQVEVVFFSDHLSDPEAVVDRLADFDIVVTMRERTPLTAAMLEKLKRVHLVVTTGMINYAIDLGAAKENGMVVCGTDGTRTGTPELSWALILGLFRHTAEHDRGIRQGNWQAGPLATDLAGSTIGLLGLGRVGTYVARVAHGFNMKVIAWSPHMTQDRALFAGADMVTKEELFERADVVSLHLVLSDTTQHIVGRKELEAMKSSAFLINTSRGPLIHEQALVEALANGRIAGAGLDVFDIEPLPNDHPFCKLPNVLLTPHVGYNTLNCYKIMFADIVEDIQAFLDGKPIRTMTES